MSSSVLVRPWLRALAVLAVVASLLVSAGVPAEAATGRISVKQNGSPTREIASVAWSSGSVRARSGKLEQVFTFEGTDRRDDGGVVCIRIDRRIGEGRWTRVSERCAKDQLRPVSISSRMKWRLRDPACEVRISASVRLRNVELGRRVATVPCG